MNFTSRENFLSETEKSNILKLARNQNKLLSKRFSTKYSKVSYKNGQMKYLSNYIFYLIWLYFILSAFYLGILFIGPRAQTFTSYYKIGVLIMLVIFPYLATPVEMFFLKMFTYIIETLIGNVYERPDFEYVIDYNAVPNIFSY